MNDKDFAGRNGFIWWTGVVVDRKDPANVGRCKVRIIGWHDENKNKVPVEDLPWAQVLLPVNNSNSISLPKEGDWVSGYFLDGENGQLPVIFGVYPGIVTNKLREYNNDTEYLVALETKLVVEKTRLADMQSVEGYGNSAIEGQKAIIADVEKEISVVKTRLKRKSNTPWTDERTQEEINQGPKLPTDVVQYVQNEPTIPRLGRGILDGTMVNKNNKDLAHVCDFISEMQKNINLKKYTKALANQIRELIRKVMKALGFTDATGQYSWILNTLKAFARELRRIQKEIIQPIIDFEKYVLAYITKIRAMITWLLSLPERFLQMLYDCYQRLLKLIAQIMFDTIAGLKEGGSMGEVGEIITAAKDVANATYSLVNSAGVAVGGAQVIINSATTGILIPVSEAEVESANNYINTYTSSSNNAITSALSSLQLP